MTNYEESDVWAGLSLWYQVTARDCNLVWYFRETQAGNGHTERHHQLPCSWVKLGKYFQKYNNIYLSESEVFSRCKCKNNCKKPWYVLSELPCDRLTEWNSVRPWEATSPPWGGRRCASETSPDTTRWRAAAGCWSPGVTPSARGPGGWRRVQVMS